MTEVCVAAAPAWASGERTLAEAAASSGNAAFALAATAASIGATTSSATSTLASRSRIGGTIGSVDIASRSGSALASSASISSRVRPLSSVIAVLLDRKDVHLGVVVGVDLADDHGLIGIGGRDRRDRVVVDGDRLIDRHGEVVEAA